jgi:hypothetical protein
MFKIRTHCAPMCVLSLFLLCCCAQSALAVNPSLCLSAPTGCDEPGSSVNIQVLLGSGDPSVVGVQFQLSFDPEALSALEILPGSACDPTSPFQLEIHQEIDQVAGTLFYAVGIDFGGTGTNQAATVACVRFLPRGVSSSEISILAGTQPRSTRMSDDLGHLVTIDNSLSCPSAIPGTLAVRQAVVNDVCQCKDEADCATLDGQCRVGVCDGSSLLCEVMPIDEGATCNDFNDCTTIDRCQAGVCTGSGCTNPSLCLGGGGCTPPDSLMVVPVLLGEGDPVITGGQFSLQWDTAGLELVDVQPGSACDPASPFVLEVQRLIDAVEGELFYAVGIGLGGEGTTGPATMACLSFRVLDGGAGDVCLYEEINPFRTKLVDDHGQFVAFFNKGSCSSDMGYPFMDCEQGSTCEFIPTTSEWGCVVLALGFLIGAKLRFRPQVPA